MSAPDLETLFDFESQVETAFVALLKAQNIDAVGTDRSDILNTPRVEVSASVTRQGPHEHVVASGSLANRRVYDQIQVSVELAVVADPSASQSAGNLRGLLRKALLFIPASSLNAELSYLEVMAESLRQTRGQRTARATEGAVDSMSGLDLEVFIKDSAWPA
jgi:hypothetical protein